MRGALISTAFVATVAAQGVTSIIPPPGTAPSQCQASADGRWELSVEPIEPEKPTTPIAPVSAVPVAPVIPVAPMPGMPAAPVPGLPVAPLAPIQPSPSGAPMPMEKRAEPIKNTLLVTLNNGVLKDRYNRVGYIAANRQFQFDGPPQAGALYTAGFSLCNNGTLALGPSAVFYRCQSGDFYNLYDKKWAAHCNGIYIHATKARDTVVTEVPPIPSTAPPVVLPPASAPASAPATTPVVIVPPASTTMTANPSALSTASSLSSVASSASSVASSASSSASRIAAGATVPTAPGAPVEPSQASDGDRVQVSAAAALSMALIFAALML